MSDQNITLLDVTFDLEGAMYVLKCNKCKTVYESRQKTFMGLGISRHICHSCNTSFEVGPEAYLKTLNVVFGRPSINEILEEVNDASNIVENWYKKPPFNKILEANGINLGEPMERELLHIISYGIRQNILKNRLKK
jgi:transposase-like protein